MAYLAPAAFRADSLDEACAGMTPLTEDDASDAALTAAIARISSRIDEWTVDHFEPPSPDTDVALDIDAEGGARLYLPRRCRSVTSVKTRDQYGTLSAAADTSAYRLHGSLNAAGTDTEDGRMLDWLELVPWGIGLPAVTWGSSLYTWPIGTGTVQVTGKFDWAGVPGDIQRATALLVWDHFKQIRPSLRVAESVQTDTTVVRFEKPDPSLGIYSGIHEADEIIGRRRRAPRVLVA